MAARWTGVFPLSSFAPIFPPLSSKRLAASIERAVQRETHGGVRNLCVEVNGSGVYLRGRCPTYYLKQLAQHAAMGLPGGHRLTNQIEVS